VPAKLPLEPHQRTLRNLRVRLSNAIKAVTTAPDFDGKSDLAKVIFDVDKLAHKLQAELDAKAHDSER
jgi:hypothetical protein